MSEAKTEEATPRRERRAREQGRAWQSRDLSLGAVLVAAGGLLRLGASATREGFAGLFTRAIERVNEGTFAPRAALDETMLAGTGIALPLLVAAVAMGAMVSAVQVGGLFAPGAIAPDGSRIAPSARFAGSTALLGLARLVLVLVVALWTLHDAMPGIASLARQPVGAAFDACVTVASALGLRVGLAMLAFGVIDALVERMRFRESLRMTRREREREQREAEGDEHVRRERARARDELARAGALDDAEGAVLVVIDDALAVALAYDASDPDAVPTVTAVGRGALADEIVRNAEDRGTPRISDAALATQLSIIPVGGVIPEPLYEPVARAMQARP